MALEEVRAYPKTTQLARAERKYRRKVASPKRWQAIMDAKQGPCRVCQAPPPNELHHLVPRGAPYFGADTEANLVPLCRACHAAVEQRHPHVTRRMLLTLDDAEYSFAVEHGGEDFFQRRYGLRFELVR